MTLSDALAEAVATLRSHLADPMARIGVLAPSSTNASLARQQLALAGPMIRVDFLTAERIVLDRGHSALTASGLKPEPPGWLSGTIRAFLASKPEALGAHAETLSRSGWSQPLTSALRRLEEAGVAAEDLLTLDDSHAAVLAAVLQHVVDQRGETWASLAETARASLSGTSPLDGIQGVVVLGRHRLAPCVAEALATWLEERPAVRIELGLGPMKPSAASMVEPLVVLEATTTPQTLIASTPDEVRECREVVRAVLDAVRGGIPLDRLAVAVPDTTQIDVLRTHLEDARIPTRFQLGVPLSRHPAAVLLGLAIELSRSRRVTDWYAVLRTPGLRLGKQLGIQVTGRGRWRRILSRSRASGARLADGLSAWIAATEREEDIEAATHLRSAVVAIDNAIDAWAAPAPLHEHAARWADFLADWLGRPSAPVVQVLRSVRGPVLSRDEAWEEVQALLAESTPDPIARRALLVSEPMGLLGGAFDRTFLLGATEGRLPRQQREDPLLPDRLVEALGERGFQLESAADVRAREARRYRAVLAATTGRIWVSCPRFEMVEGRPQLPSSLLLQDGETYEALRSRMVRQGSRAHLGQAEPERATDERERLLCHAPEDRGAALVNHPTARRVLEYHLAVARVEAGGTPCAWTGRIPAELLVLPGVEEACRPGQISGLAADPGDFLLKQLGAWPPQRLRDSWDPTDRYIFASLQIAALLSDEGLAKALDAALDDDAEFREVGEARLALARGMLHARTPALTIGEVAESRAKLGPLKIQGELGWLEGGALHVLRREKDAPADALVQALACGCARLVVHTPEGGEKAHEVLGGPLVFGLRLAGVGWFPFVNTPPLVDDPQFDSDESVQMLRELR